MNCWSVEENLCFAGTTGLHLQQDELNYTYIQPSSVRDVRFRMSLKKHISFIEWLRLRLDCPFGIRIHLKKTTVLQCRKINKWLKTQTRRMLRKQGPEGASAGEFDRIFTPEKMIQNDYLKHAPFSYMDVSTGSVNSGKTSNTVIYSPRYSPLFIPLAEQSLRGRPRSA